MIYYLKTMGGYKHNQLKGRSYEEIQKLFDKAYKQVNSFVPMDLEVVKSSVTRLERSSTRAGDELESDKSKKQKIDEHVEAEKDNDQEEADMKKHIEIVKYDEVVIDAIPLATKPPMIVDYKINIDREDLETLWKLVKAKHGNTRPEEDYERVLWGDLKVMFKPDIKSKVWRSLQGYKVTIWKLFDTCGVHFVSSIRRMIKESVDVAIAVERARHANVRNDARGSGLVRGQDDALVIRECTFARFMKCNPTAFHGIKGAVELLRWFEKTKSVFRIGECVKGKKVKFAAATLQGPALTWWNAKVATMGLKTVNQMLWIEMKQLMTAEFCPIEEVQRMENELWNLEVKEYNIVAYTQRFNELALMCPRMVEPERVKVDAYIRGLTDNIKGENNQKQGNARAMVTAPSDGKVPLRERCFTRHVGQCTVYYEINLYLFLGGKGLILHAW
ncbi:putative reverse transcriptase domain-containing protein [Tanacetum coccineum]